MFSPADSNLFNTLKIDLLQWRLCRNSLRQQVHLLIVCPVSVVDEMFDSLVNEAWSYCGEEVLLSQHGADYQLWNNCSLQPKPPASQGLPFSCSDWVLEFYSSSAESPDSQRQEVTLFAFTSTNSACVCLSALLPVASVSLFLNIVTLECQNLQKCSVSTFIFFSLKLCPHGATAIAFVAWQRQLIEHFIRKYWDQLGARQRFRGIICCK